MSLNVVFMGIYMAFSTPVLNFGLQRYCFSTGYENFLRYFFENYAFYLHFTFFSADSLPYIKLNRNP